MENGSKVAFVGERRQLKKLISLPLIGIEHILSSAIANFLTLCSSLFINYLAN